ncbi:MAG: hypothetical protein V2I66_00710 [Halieaceae bacterium]|jgi:hypothetical protein|nr:hypothetical protein [Halieaceae bacterium]
MGSSKIEIIRLQAVFYCESLRFTSIVIESSKPCGCSEPNITFVISLDSPYVAAVKLNVGLKVAETIAALLPIEGLPHIQTAAIGTNPKSRLVIFIYREHNGAGERARHVLRMFENLECTGRWIKTI